MIYVTGDKHRGFASVASFCNCKDTTKEDILVILGDAVINHEGELDRELKAKLEQLPITLLCVHGNHECRPSNIETYKEVPFKGGVVYQEAEFRRFYSPRMEKCTILEARKQLSWVVRTASTNREGWHVV